MSVFHIKYRPQKIAELDLPEVSVYLEKILKQKEKPQSFLLAGPKGSGKTSSARIIAKAINCLNPDGVEPCGKCANCVEISHGNSMDVIEIDGASNRGIEDIRSLKEGAYLSPVKLKNKVFIIDEVHMLTKEAFNALLKLIEEPPMNTVFLLCTTDPEKIPETVLSRLTKIEFRKGKPKELLNSIKKVINSEKIEISDVAMEMLVGRSDGSFRNIQRTMNELIVSFGKKVEDSEVMDFLSKKSGDFGETELEKMLSAGETKEILSRLEAMANNGVDFRSFRERLVTYLQKRLLSFYGVDIGVDGKLTKDEVVKLINLLIQAGKVEKETAIGQLPLELVVVEFCKTKSTPTPSFDEGGEKDGKRGKAAEVEVVEEAISSDDNFTISVEEVGTAWGQLLMTIKPYNHSVEAFLRASRPAKTRGRTLILEVFYPFHKDRLEEPRNRKIVEMGLKKVFHVDMSFECVLAKSKKPVLVISNDTPVEKVNENLSANQNEEKKDIYDVAKEIFG